MKIIQRTTYFDKIRPFIGKQIIKVLVGQRRVGKSFMMLHIIEEIRKSHPNINIIYIDKEKSEFDKIRDYNDLLGHIEANKKQTNAIFIDEIQDILQFEKALRSLHTEPGIDLYCTGSNANMLSGELATVLSGRYVEIPVYSLSYSEFLEFHQKTDSPESLNLYLKYGGLPGLIHLPLEDHIIFDYLNNIYAAVLFKDLIRRYAIRNVSFLENLVHFLADNIGSIVSAKKISDYLKSQQVKISPNVVLDYLGYLNNTFLTYKTNRYEIAGKKMFEIGEKHYFEDLGLRNSIVGYKTTDIHKLIENAVFSHLKFRGYHVNVGVLGTQEVDFVGEKHGEKVYVQVCYLLAEQRTIDREFGNLLKIKDQYPKMVVSMDDFGGTGTYSGVAHYNLRRFLMEF